MTNRLAGHSDAAATTGGQNGQAGFTLMEFLISAVILLVVVSAVFTIMSEIQRTASYQAEVQSVLNNTRIAMQTIERYVRQAGNDPLGNGLCGLTIVSPTEVRIQSDLTGSLGPSSPDKGDPDGDTNDSGENVTIRYNSGTRSLEVVPNGGSAQIVAGYISGLSFSFYDAYGGITNVGSQVRKIAVSISGSSPLANPQTHQIFGVRLGSEIRIMT
jgi:prepilin-type N-terminal cleavage/methylation domain-containing protein